MDTLRMEIKEVGKLRTKLRTSTFILMTVLLMVFGIGNVVFAQEVIEFELEIELKDHQEYDIEYEVKGDRYKAEYQVPGSEKIYGEEAKEMIDPLLEQLTLQPDMNKNDLRKQIISILEIDEKNIEEFELEVEFSDGSKIKIDR